MKIADSRLPILIQLSLKTRPLLREPFDLPPLVVNRRIFFSISEVALHLLLIMVAFSSSRGVHLLAPWLQIPAEGSSLENICTRNYSAPLHFSALVDSVAVFFPFLIDSTKLHGWRGQSRQAHDGGGSRGRHVGEPAPSSYEVRSISSAHGDELL